MLPVFKRFFQGLNCLSFLGTIFSPNSPVLHALKGDFFFSFCWHLSVPAAVPRRAGNGNGSAPAASGDPAHREPLAGQVPVLERRQPSGPRSEPAPSVGKILTHYIKRSPCQAP